jgi:hypothetical protein
LRDTRLDAELFAVGAGLVLTALAMVPAMVGTGHGVWGVCIGVRVRAVVEGQEGILGRGFGFI